jgi:hypothetical protein
VKRSAIFFAACIVACAIASPIPGRGADIFRPDPSTAAPQEADLTHLIFTSDDPAPATLISPVPGGDGGASTPFVVATSDGAGVELSVDGTVVDFSHIGKRDVVRATGETRYTYYGVGLAPGPNDIVLTALGAGNRRAAPTHYIVYGRGPAVTVRSSLAGRLIADGRSVRVLHVEGIDRWNHPAMAGIEFTATVRSGDLHLGDGSTSTPSPAPSAAAPIAFATPPSPEIAASADPAGFATSSVNPQLGLAAGAPFKIIADATGGADIPLCPGLRTGDATVRIAYDDRGDSIDVGVYVWPYLRQPTVTGLVTGGIGAIPGDPGTDATAPYEADSRAGRIALYAGGQIAPTISASGAYDTAGVLDETGTYGSFNEDPDARPYLTYGDSSQRRDDALSTNHLYLDVSSGRSQASYGEFEAKTGNDAAGSLGGFEMLMNGAKLDLATASSKLELFRGTAGVSYGREVVNPNGLASTNFDLHPNVVVGSDSLTLVVLDRHLGYIVSESGLERNVDYVIDYGAGVIRFINPPLAYDPSFNPQEVLIQYEYASAGGAVATGGRVAAKVGGVTLASGYADDATGTGNVTLFGQSATGALGNGTFSLEHLTTSGGIGNDIPSTGEPVAPPPTTEGNAYRGAILGGLGTVRYDVLVQTTSQGFSNPFGGLSTPGLSSDRVSLTDPIKGGDVALLLDAERNAYYGARSSDTSTSVRVHEKFGRKLKTTAALSHHVVSGNGVTTQAGAANLAPSDPLSASPALPTAAPVSATAAGPLGGAVNQFELGASYAFSSAVSASVDRVSDIGGDADASLANPAQTTAEADVLLGKAGRAYLRELWTDAPTTPFAASTQALTTAAASTHLTQIGIERQIGSATTIDTQYSIANTATGSDLYAAIGVKERVVASKKLEGDLLLQHALAEGAGTGGFNVYGFSLAYNPSANFRATSAYQLRTGATPGSTFQLGAVGYLGSGFSLVSAFDDTNAVGISTADERLSLAFRPQDDDASVVLLGADHFVGVGDVQGERTDVASLDAVHRFTTKTEVTGRLAYEIDGDAYYPAHTSLAGVRIVQRAGPRFDIAGDVRASGIGGVSQSSVAGYALETGYRVGDAFRVAAGYNFSQTPDLSLAAPPRHKGFYVTATSVISSLFGFGKDR